MLWTKAWDLHPAFAPLTHLLFIFFPSKFQLSKSPKSNRILNFRIFCAFIATQKHIKHIHHSPLVIYQYLHILHKFFGHYYCAQCLKNIACNGSMMSLNYATFLPFILFALFKMCNMSFFSPCYVFHLNKLFLEKNTLSLHFFWSKKVTNQINLFDIISIFHANNDKNIERKKMWNVWKTSNPNNGCLFKE